jgi:hypothetical protein
MARKVASVRPSRHCAERIVRNGLPRSKNHTTSRDIDADYFSLTALVNWLSVTDRYQCSLPAGISDL